MSLTNLLFAAGRIFFTCFKVGQQINISQIFCIKNLIKKGESVNGCVWQGACECACHEG